MARWPGVPDVYGWLTLDARGNFRIRTGGPGAEPRFETVANRQLIAFIGRNYQSDAHGRWFFQNGPQRVFVRLAATPWVYRFDAAGAIVSHTGAPAGGLREVLFDASTGPILVTALGPGVIDDRDLGVFVGQLVDAGGEAVADAGLERWLAAPEAGVIWFACGDRRIAVEPAQHDELAVRLGFDPDPAPPSAAAH